MLVLLAVYTGWQAKPFGEFPIYSLATVFAITMGLASFKALMYLQQSADGAPLTYEALFTNSWRNFLTGVLAGLFTGFFWLILLLWGRLFEVIGIEFFWDLYREDWFIIPVLAVAFGLGVSLFRALTRAIDNITQLLHWLIKLLLPLVLLVAAVFLGALPFTGLELLWDTGSGTALLLWLLALVLFFTNAVYQDGREADPYPPLLHRAIYAALCLMPIVAALAFYGLLLRVQQYGWTIERCWAFVVWGLLTLFAVGYVVGIVRRRDDWTADLARVNTAMGLVVLAVLIAANSPLLDFRKISLASQLARVESGEIEPAEFDFWYAEQNLARPGHLAMEEMKAEIGDSDPELVAMIEQPVPGQAALPLDSDAFWAGTRYRPEPFEIPVGLKPVIGRVAPAFEKQVPVLIRADLDDDGTDEYALLVIGEQCLLTAFFFYRDGNRWRTGYLNLFEVSDKRFDRDRFIDSEIRVTDPRYRNLSIGGVELRPFRSE